jgi:carboxymethylenebutenolidase
MNVTSSVVDLGRLRVRVFVPVTAQPRRWPGVLAYSDIFQHTGPHLRLCTRLAARGFVVVAPELYGRLEPSGTVFDFEAERQRALDAAGKMELPWFDDDTEVALSFLRSHVQVDASRLFGCGWCIGGHLTFRAARAPDMKATACFYATGLHSDSVGAASGTAKSLGDARKILGRVLLVWGTRDPHIPKDGRERIHAALAQAGVTFDVANFEAEHAFMRDEGARWEPAAADAAFEQMVRLFSQP